MFFGEIDYLTVYDLYKPRQFLPGLPTLLIEGKTSKTVLQDSGDSFAFSGSGFTKKPNGIKGLKIEFTPLGKEAWQPAGTADVDSNGNLVMRPYRPTCDNDAGKFKVRVIDPELGPSTSVIEDITPNSKCGPQPPPPTPPSGSLSIERALDTNQNCHIDESELNQALGYWTANKPVPNTGGKVIGDLKITQVATFKIQVVSGFPHRSRSFMRQFFSPLLQRL